MLTSLGLDRQIEVSDLAQHYLEISGHHEDPASPTGRLRRERSDSSLHLAARGLIFARRTYLVARHLAPLLTALPEPSSITEVGAGFAPGLLALGSAEQRLFANELFPDYRAAWGHLFSAAGLPNPVASLEAAPHLTGDRAWTLFTYSLYEIAAGRAETAAERIQSLLRNGSSVVVLEPGDSTHAKFIEEIRDQLAASELHPVAPCPRTSTCPAALSGRDWCHFTLRASLGPLATRALAVAKRRSQDLHFSALIYSPLHQMGPGDRVLSVHPEGSQKMRANLCTPSGFRRLIALRRHRDAYERLARLAPFDHIEVSSDAVGKGDGLRISASVQVQAVEGTGQLVKREPLRLEPELDQKTGA